MPVSHWISGGIGTPGLTSDDHSVTRCASPSVSTVTMPTSVTRSRAGDDPVVSTSTNTHRRSANAPNMPASLCAAAGAPCPSAGVGGAYSAQQIREGTPMNKPPSSLHEERLAAAVEHAQQKVAAGERALIEVFIREYYRQVDPDD